MKKTIKTVAMFAMLGMLTVGCQKENVNDNMYVTANTEVGTMYMVQYAIDGVQYHAIHHSKAEHSAFIYYLLDLVEHGHEVIFCEENKQNSSVVTKDVVHYTTSSKTDAFEWASQKEDEGYKVQITYDPDNMIFHCVAWK